ncbi:hypothetical protein ACWPM1_08695 [Tsuneonella sp. HG249]
MRGAVVLSALMLAACGQGGEGTGESAEDFAERAGVGAPSQAAAPQVAEINAQPVVAPTGAAQLTPLSADAQRALGPFQGGCSFAYQGRSLLVVRGPATPGGSAEGVLVVDGQQVLLPGTQQPIESGPTLTGAGYTVTVMRAEGSPQTIGGRREYTADLKIAGPQGDTTFSPGTWSCTS